MFALKRSGRVYFPARANAGVRFLVSWWAVAQQTKDGSRDLQGMSRVTSPRGASLLSHVTYNEAWQVC